jgi:hypothetical protein
MVLPKVSKRVSRRQRIVALAASAVLLCPGITSCTRTQVGLSVAAMATVLVGVTVGITLAVQHSHHTLQGCIVSGPNGLELRLNDAKVYTLEGELADVKVGDKLKIHGSKLKKVKGASAEGQVFVVEKVNKDYGSCLAGPAISQSASH